MVDRYGSQFVRCSREVLSLKSEDWNKKNTNNKDRLKNYLFFLRGRGLKLLQLFLQEEESIAGTEMGIIFIINRDNSYKLRF